MYLETRISRRAALTGAVAGAAVLTAGRCRAAAQATPVGTVTVETIHGPIDVPANPLRVVAVNFPSAVTLLELGVTPVGVPSYMPALPAGHPTADGIEVIDNDLGELNLEKIISLQPDLIVGSDWEDPADQVAPYEELSAIAPTALFVWTQAAGNWAAEAEGVAEALGKTAELAALKSSYEEKAASIAETYKDLLAEYTWDLLSANDSEWYLYGPTSSHSMVVAKTGIRFGAAADQADGFKPESFEQLGILQDTGVLLVRSAGDNGLDVLNAQPLFTGLPAVQAGRVVTTDYFFPSSYALSEALLDDIESGLSRIAPVA